MGKELLTAEIIKDFKIYFEVKAKKPPDVVGIAETSGIRQWLC